eukprot:488270-Rhodomonas_salina.1
MTLGQALGLTHRRPPLLVSPPPPDDGGGGNDVEVVVQRQPARRFSLPDALLAGLDVHDPLSAISRFVGRSPDYDGPQWDSDVPSSPPGYWSPLSCLSSCASGSREIVVVGAAESDVVMHVIQELTDHAAYAMHVGQLSEAVDLAREIRSHGAPATT